MSCMAGLNANWISSMITQAPLLQMWWQGAGKYGVYHGTFKVDVPTDTFLNTTGWGKGVAVINGNNLGRYWASEGPQMTLYVPAAFLQPGENSLLVLELEGTSNCSEGTCSLSLVEQPVYVWSGRKTGTDYWHTVL
ncbi:hypothetical protein ANCCAN_11548 [Ancylostoma caninum]|uniref:Beta-galactosidase galactose-binding domain-containing protein n=1 Tax=Ancylostoma caninum TaxID=29170 RepID=A0A368GDN7_ANCCA|nr:hypothetical protein ANCCAN_11548 [Ancylostoma caninum]